jgi:hypothetical protein
MKLLSPLGKCRLLNTAVSTKSRMAECRHNDGILIGLRLLVPLTKSTDEEVQRLSAHALANLSVNGEQVVEHQLISCYQTEFVFVADNQEIMSREGAIEMLIELLDTNHELTLRQSAKALANLGM